MNTKYYRIWLFSQTEPEFTKISNDYEDQLFDSYVNNNNEDIFSYEEISEQAYITGLEAKGYKVCAECKEVQPALMYEPSTAVVCNACKYKSLDNQIEEAFEEAISRDDGAFSSDCDKCSLLGTGCCGSSSGQCEVF